MALLNYVTRELTAKIVYYGPGLCGKTTNLKFIYENSEDEHHSKMLTLSTEADRTLFFDFLPMDLGTMRGIKIRVQLYTVPGQVFYEETRRRVLKGCDGVVFVADSQRSMAEANMESVRQLYEHLDGNGHKVEDVPLVIQYNKRDLGDLLSIDDLDRDLNPNNAPFFEAVASEGIGVEDTLRAAIRLVLKNLVDKGIVRSPDEQEQAMAPARGGGNEVIPVDISEPLLLQNAEPELGLDTGDDLIVDPAGTPAIAASFPPPVQLEAGSLPPAKGRDPEWLFSEPGKEEDVLFALDGTGGLAAAVLQEETGAETVFLESITEAEPGARSALVDVHAEPRSSTEEPPLPHLRLRPGQSLEADIEIGGQTYRLKIELQPVSRDG